jgi:enoyl-CoA hydratase
MAGEESTGPERIAAQTVGYEQRGAIAVLTLQRPEKLNAIDAGMVAALQRGLDRAEADESVRAVVLRGLGRAFSAGFDLGPGGTERNPVAMRAELRSDFDVIMRFWDFPKPTIAAVHGYCLGSGMEMAVACDVTVAAEGCRFGAPEVRFGSGIVALILPWVVGPKVAKELLLTGDDSVSAERALAIGLVNRVVPAERCFEEALEIAGQIAVNDQLAVALTKQAINRGAEIMGMRQALLQALEIDVLVESSETPESKAFDAILEKEGVRAALAWRKRAR